MTQLPVNPGESLTALASRVFNGDSLRFTEILDLNPNLDVFSDLLQETQIQIPDVRQVLNFAKPALSRVSSAIGSAGSILNQAESAIGGLSGKLSPELQGYATQALEQIGELNGILGDVEVAIAGAESGLREYEGQLVQLVPWLLGGK